MVDDKLESKIETAKIEILVKSEVGKFMSYAFDSKFFYLVDKNVYVNRGKTYELLKGGNDG